LPPDFKNTDIQFQFILCAGVRNDTKKSVLRFILAYETWEISEDTRKK